MGRGKLQMEFIENQKARKLATEKRKMNLKKKAHELSTLCDVPVCLIMYNHDDLQNSEPPLLYPENRDVAESIITRYLSIAKDGSCSKRSLDLEDVLQEGGIKKRRKVVGLISPNLISGLSRDQLSEMAAVLDHKLQFVQRRIAEFGDNVNPDPDFGFMADQKLGMCSANCYDQQEEQQSENGTLYSGSQICCADQQQLSLMGSTSSSVLGSQGFDPDFGFMVSDQELELWSANCYDQQQPLLADENAMLYSSGSQSCCADHQQQQLMGSTCSSGLEAVLGGVNFY